MAGRESDVHETKYVLFSPLSKIGSSYINFCSPSSLLCVFTADIHLEYCGAVFAGAGEFNGDLSKWQVVEVVDMTLSTYILYPMSGHFFVGRFFSPSLFL